VAKKNSGNVVVRFIRNVILILITANISYLVITKWINPPITTVMAKSIIDGYGLKRDYITYQEMGINAKLAVICSEDQLFPDHNGFDWSAIKKAIEYNRNPKHKKVRGASTISQQTAKNVFLWNGRDWFRKGLEVYHTFLIELVWGKKRILETYLNVAETGKGMFGIQAAAQYYFHKDAAQLSRREAALIAAILPNPKVYSAKHPSASLSRRQNWILSQMNNLHDDPEILALIK
jgi:monofunctional biosynthetic peptidoglycan transglycosylase